MWRTTKYVAFNVHQATTEGGQEKLNTRPRKRLCYRTPEECYARRRSLLHFKPDIKHPLARDPH